MKRWFVMAAYRSRVEGVPGGSIDIQVRYFEARSADEAERLLEAEFATQYQNKNGETVVWELSSVFATEEVVPYSNGDEVIGFITNLEELGGDA